MFTGFVAIFIFPTVKDGIVLKTNSGYFISEDTSVSAGGHKFDKVAFKANLEIREMSTELRIYTGV